MAFLDYLLLYISVVGTYLGSSCSVWESLFQSYYFSAVISQKLFLLFLDMLVLCFKQMSIGSLWVEIEKGITKASFSCDIKTGFSELWPGFLPLHVRHLNKVPKSLTSTAASRLQLFFSLLHIPPESAHLSLLSIFPWPGMDHAVIPEVLKVACMLEVLFPAVSLEDTAQDSRVVPTKWRCL